MPNGKRTGFAGGAPYYSADLSQHSEDDEFQAFQYAEKVADDDRIVVVTMVEWVKHGTSAGMRQYWWMLPWATEWSKFNYWDLNSFERLNFAFEPLFPVRRLEREITEKLIQYGNKHFNKYHTLEWLGLD